MGWHEGYTAILKDFETVSILMLLLTAACLSGVFPEEHMRRTDQMILSSAKGKYMVYWAKLSAGISVSFICAVVMGIVAITAALVIYGPEGFQTAVQMYLNLATYSYPLSIGQACIIAYCIFLLTAVLLSVLVMVASQWQWADLRFTDSIRGVREMTPSIIRNWLFAEPVLLRFADCKCQYIVRQLIIYGCNL